MLLSFIVTAVSCQDDELPHRNPGFFADKFVGNYVVDKTVIHHHLCDPLDSLGLMCDDTTLQAFGSIVQVIRYASDPSIRVQFSDPVNFIQELSESGEFSMPYNSQPVTGSFYNSNGTGIDSFHYTMKTYLPDSEWNLTVVSGKRK